MWLTNQHQILNVDKIIFLNGITKIYYYPINFVIVLCFYFTCTTIILTTSWPQISQSPAVLLSSLAYSIPDINTSNTCYQDHSLIS